MSLGGGTIINSSIWQEDYVSSDIWYEESEAFIQKYSVLIADELLQAVYISLFSDQRFTFVNGEPVVNEDRRGWWGDNIDEPKDLIGSSLWLLDTRKMVDSKIISDAKSYAEKALKWLLEDKVASDVSVTVTRYDNYSLLFVIVITKPEDDIKNEYAIIWNLLENNIKNGVI